jgi:glutamyl-tRNA reductase
VPSLESVRDLYLIGLSHRTAPVAARERYAVRPEDLDQCLKDLVAANEIEETAVVSTCNRTEVIVRAREGTNPIDLIKRTIFRNADSGQVYLYQALQAVIHAFRVASGLDSLVLGESEILGQVRRAREGAKAAGTLGPLLGPLLEQALVVGKRVRTDTDIGQGSLSVARIAVGVAQRAFGKLDNERALVIGAGETGLLVAKHLTAAGMTTIDFANRTLLRAEEAAAQFGGTGYGLEQMSVAISYADVVAVAVDAAPDLVHASIIDRKALRRRDMPLFLLDLSVPRAVAQDVIDLDQAITYGLDDLAKVVETNHAERTDSIAQADELIVHEVHEFLARRAYALFSPTLAGLGEHFEKMREEILDQITGGQAEAREIKLAHTLSRRLLHLSQSQFKDGMRRVRSEAALDAEYQRFLENL